MKIQRKKERMNDSEVENKQQDDGLEWTISIIILNVNGVNIIVKRLMVKLVGVCLIISRLYKCQLVFMYYMSILFISIQWSTDSVLGMLSQAPFCDLFSLNPNNLVLCTVSK
jgi:hypothetical protein